MRIILLLAMICAWSKAMADEVREVVSPQGVRAWLVQEHSLPLISLKAIFRDSGYARDPKGKEGRASMVSELLMEGAGSMDALAFGRALEEDAVHLDFSADEDFLRISLESLSERKDRAFALLGAALTEPRFDKSAMERVRARAQTHLARQEQQPSYMLQSAWQKAAFPGHGYGAPGIGTRRSLETLTRADVATYASRYLTRENLIVAVVGDITPEALGPLLDRTFGALPARFLPESEIAEVKPAGGGKVVVVKHDIPQALVTFSLPGVKRDDPDFFAAFVMNHLLGGQGALTSRLAEEIREKRGLAYSVSTQLQPMLHAGVWTGDFATRRAEASAAIQTLKDTLGAFTASGPSDAELADAKRYLTGSFVLSLDSNGDVANFLLSMQVNGLGIDYLDKRNRLVESVGTEDIRRMAARLLDPAKLLLVVVGEPDGVNPAP